MIRLIKESNNLHKLQLGDLDIWFSYETPIAFQYWGDVIGGEEYKHFHITKNIWSSTTGRHLNLIDEDTSKRIDNKKFYQLLNKVIEKLG